MNLGNSFRKSISWWRTRDAGAIVNGVTGKKKTKRVYTSLKIKVTVNDINNSTVYITFLDTATKKDGFVYKTKYKLAHECLTIQLICDQQEALERGKSNNTESSVDEILKFKQLLDQGIITLEEFDAKKKTFIELTTKLKPI